MYILIFLLVCVYSHVNLMNALQMKPRSWPQWRRSRLREAGNISHLLTDHIHSRKHTCVCLISFYFYNWFIKTKQQMILQSISGHHICPFKLVYELCVRRSLWIYVSSWESSDPNTWTPMLNKSENFLLFPKLWSYIFPTNEIWSNIVSSMIQYIL